MTEPGGWGGGGDRERGYEAEGWLNRISVGVTDTGNVTAV